MLNPLGVSPRQQCPSESCTLLSHRRTRHHTEFRLDARCSAASEIASEIASVFLPCRSVAEIRELSAKTIGGISVLHETLNIPMRLQQDAAREEGD